MDSTKPEEEIKVITEQDLEVVPIVIIYQQGKEVKGKINDIDKEAIDIIKVYGYLKLYLKKLEYDLIEDDYDE